MEARGSQGILSRVDNCILKATLPCEKVIVLPVKDDHVAAYFYTNFNREKSPLHRHRR